MPKTIKLELVTPQRHVLSQMVESIVLPGAEGSFGVLPGHLSWVAALNPGMLKVKFEGREIIYALGGGHAEIMPHQAVILADSAELAEDIDIEAAQKQRTRALAQLKQGVRGPEMEIIEVSLRKAMARLKTVEIIRHRKNKSG